MKMWSEYFSDSTILGIDIDTSLCRFRQEGFGLIKCDSTDEARMNAELRDSRFDFIIDDGSHVLEHQIATLKILFPRLKPGGVYFIEDIADIFAATPILLESAKVLHADMEVFDMRNQKGRFDDVIVTLTHKHCWMIC